MEFTCHQSINWMHTASVPSTTVFAFRVFVLANWFGVLHHSLSVSFSHFMQHSPAPTSFRIALDVFSSVWYFWMAQTWQSGVELELWFWLWFWPRWSGRFFSRLSQTSHSNSMQSRMQEYGRGFERGFPNLKFCSEANILWVLLPKWYFVCAARSAVQATYAKRDFVLGKRLIWTIYLTVCSTVMPAWFESAHFKNPGQKWGLLLDSVFFSCWSLSTQTTRGFDHKSSLQASNSSVQKVWIKFLARLAPFGQL